MKLQRGLWPHDRMTCCKRPNDGPPSPKGGNCKGVGDFKGGIGNTLKLDVKGLGLGWRGAVLRAISKEPGRTQLHPPTRLTSLTGPGMPYKMNSWGLCCEYRTGVYRQCRC